MKGILPPVPCRHSRKVCWACPGRSQPKAKGSRPGQCCYYDTEALPSSTICLLPCPQLPGPLPQMACGGPERVKLLKLHPGSWQKAPPPPCRLAEKGTPIRDTGSHQRLLSLSLGGWKLLLDMSIKALWKHKFRSQGSAGSSGSGKGQVFD